MQITPLAILQPINFRMRSPYSFAPSQQALPPATMPVGAEVVADSQGNMTVAGSALTPFQNNNAVTAAPAIATFDTGNYADAVVIAIKFTAPGFAVDGMGNNIIFNLLRPNNTRTSLLIVNASVLGNVYYNWDKAADNVTSVPIAAGGSRNWAQSPPQGNLSLFSSGAGTVIVEYANNNVG